jgi:DNA-binding transcriptional LysR family regulator
MTLVQLRHLIALAETGSFVRSAQQLALTQPALSRSIRALEDELGHPLFDRIGRRSELTAFGQEVLTRARPLVFEADALREAGERLTARETGVIRVGMGSGAGAMLMTPFLLRMGTLYPGVHAEVSRANTELLVQRLRARTLDALAIDARSLAPAPDLRMDHVYEMRGTFMCRPDHPLAKKRRVSFADLRRYPIASSPLSDEIARLLMERYGPDAHPERCVTLRCDEIASLADVARSSDTVLLAIRGAAPDLSVIAMHPPLEAPARFGLVTLAGRTEPPALRLVRELMDEYLRDR